MPTRGSERSDPPPTINIAHIPVGADIGGLVFAVGCVAIYIIGLEPVRVFFAAAVVAGVGVAILLRIWHRRRSRKDPPNRMLGIDH